MKTIRAASHPATNDRIFRLISEHDLHGKRIIDIGAGRGYMAQKLGDHLKDIDIPLAGTLHACDMFPEYFEYDEITCDQVSFSSTLPYESDSFDIVYSIEVLEHLHNPYVFISELYRITKPGGLTIISVPNILNLTSRFRYLFCGFFDLYEPLSFKDEDAGRLCGHIMPLGFFYIDHGMRKAGYLNVRFVPDKLKKSAAALYYILAPLLGYVFRRFVATINEKNPYLYSVNRKELEMINSKEVCCSRSCILAGNKPL